MTQKTTEEVKPLELRMYGLVPYNLSPIQQGIQFDHACKRYARDYYHDADFQEYLHEWETDILLNGGTSNEGHYVRHGFEKIFYIGAMQQHLKALEENEIKHATFYEPDLNSMLTAVVFLVDERVFLKKVYKDFVPVPKPLKLKIPFLHKNLRAEYERLWQEENNIKYNEWVESIGGVKNAFLREFLKDFRLA